MQLTVDERDMLEGSQGPARQRAMELLVQYGEALGARQMADTNNVTVCTGAIPRPEILRKIVPSLNIDELASKLFLDSDETIVVDRVKAFTTSNASFRDYAHPELQKGGQESCDFIGRVEEYCKRIGIVTLNSCAPYQCGNIPTKGEICAWTESSAIAYCNSILGARTNIEGQHSSFASAITGKTPRTGMLIDENRKGTVIIQVDAEMNSVLDWALLGYFAGPLVGLRVPIYNNIKTVPDLFMLMSLCAAGISSGSIVMFHIPGVTPEAATLDMASGGNKNLSVIGYGRDERRKTHAKLNMSAKDDVDVVILGCPHYSLERISAVARLLEGRKVRDNTALYITTGRMQKALADRMGFSAAIEKAGGIILEDSCGNQILMEPSAVLASDSAKILHYVPRMTGVQNTLLGTTEECVNAAVTGKWRGRVPK